jgi:hypothetical protein
VYNEAWTEVWFDPKSTPDLITGLTSDEMPFINARISGALLDFEQTVDYETYFTKWAMNRVRGQVGELPVGENHSISMQWETGKALVEDQFAYHCNIDNTTCYQAKVVPVIFSMNANSGYTSGG